MPGRRAIPPKEDPYAGIVLCLAITGLHELVLRRLERTVAAYRQA